MSLAVLEIRELFVDQDMHRPQQSELAGGTAVVYSVPAPGRIDANEDSAALLPWGDASGLLVVADGMGGQRAGAQASQLAVAALSDAIGQIEKDPALLRAAVLNGIEHAAEAVGELGVGAGTTLALVEVHQSSVRAYHVGDSMILAVGQRGKVKLQTVSHSPVGYAVEAGMLNAEEAMHHDERHLVSNYIGVEGMRIEIGSPVELAPRDTLLVASDGLFDNLHVEEIVELIRKGPLMEAACRLAEACARRMNDPQPGQPSKPDDLTFILFRPQREAA